MLARLCLPTDYSVRLALDMGESKKVIIASMLCDKRWAKTSQAAIGRLVGCSKQYVASIKDELLGIQRYRYRKMTNIGPRVYRSIVYRRDDGKCYICGKDVPEDNWHMDHIVPVSKGGLNSYSNVAVSCVGCNQSKSDKLLSPEMNEGIEDE